MGRILKVHSGQPIPTQDTNLSFKMTKLAKPVERADGEGEECKVVVDGLFWQDEITGELDPSQTVVEFVEVVWEGD